VLCSLHLTDESIWAFGTNIMNSCVISHWRKKIKHPTSIQHDGNELKNSKTTMKRTTRQTLTKSELRQLVEHFAMEDIVRVPIPNSTSRYAFNREELLIYALIKMKTRVTQSYMDDFVTHSDARRWSYGYKHFIR
jgi:hypothetical protein